MEKFSRVGRTFRGRFLIVAAFQVVLLVFASNFSNCCAGGEDVSREDQLKEASRKEPDSIEGYLALVKFYSDRDEFLKAEEAFKKALEINPSEDKAFDGLGVISLRKDDTLTSLEKAIQLGSRAIEINPNNGRALAHLEEAFAVKSRATADYTDKKSILELIEKALEQNPFDADVYQSAIACFEILGVATYDAHLIDMAIRLYAKALALEPSLYGARTSLASIYIMLGYYREATKLLDEAVAISPLRSDAYRILAEVHEAQGALALAEKAANKALEINPNKAGAYGVLAKVYAAQGKSLESDKMIESMLALNPQRVDALLKAVAVYYSVKNYSKMDELLSKAHTLNSMNGETHLWQARLDLAQGHEEKAEQSFRKAIELSPENEKAFVAISAYYEGRGDAVNARAYSQKAGELSLKSQVKIEVAAKVMSGEASKVKSDDAGKVKIDEASKVKSGEASNVKSQGAIQPLEFSSQLSVDQLKKKLRLNPRDEGSSVSLASIYVKQGRLVDAEGLLAYVVRLNPKNDQALAELGWLELKRKNKTRAESFFARSLQINPKNKSALRGRQGAS